MPIDELKLPLEVAFRAKYGKLCLVEQGGRVLFTLASTTRQEAEIIAHSHNSHSGLVAENERMRVCLSDIKELAANSAWGPDQDESLDTIREWAYQALTSDEKKGASGAD